MIEASAPGKVILFGEHAVVYGRPAIAVPVLDVQAKAILRSTDTEAGLRIVAPDLSRNYLLADADEDDPLAMTVRNTLGHLEQPPPKARLEVTSTIPLGRGLGSGAAISTAIVRALSNFFGQPLPPAEVSALVYDVEKIYHGTPSGIDNTVVAFEQPVYFIKGRPMQRMSVREPFTLIIGDTGLTAPTHQVVGNLRHRWQKDRQRYEGYFDEIGAVVQQARMAIEQETFKLEALGKLMNENQELLEALDVSSPELQQLITVARRAGAWGAKLSGAGRGGNMIALASPDKASRIARALKKAGAVGVIVTEVR